tara:strand:+ start:1166 stop:1333 length:168 start_codon:yes stop_codon:yes gene_type:complete
MDLKSRKLVCAVVLFLSACGALFLGKTDFAGWAEFMKWVFGIYAAGNVGEHVASK